MALPVLDGNQSATTLSSVVTGGEHIVAHSVVSLGTTAISNINSAVSGAVVTIPGLSHLGNSVATDGVADATTNFIKIGGHQSGSNQTSHIVHVSAGGSMSVDASGSSVTFSQASVTFGAITGSASILNFPSTQTVAGTVTVGASSVTFNSNVAKRPDGSWQPLSVEAGSGYVSARVYQSDIAPFLATVTVGNSVTIAGTVTANVPALGSAAALNASPIAVIGQNQNSPNPSHGIQIGYYSDISGTFVNVQDDGYQQLPVKGTVTVGNSVTIGSLPAISGTVTANANVVSIPLSAFPDTWISGGDTLKVDLNTIDTFSPATWLQSGGGNVPINGTVTAAAPNGSLTTRFGTPTTANTAFATSAVTNANRKYLLIQNVTTGSNVITVGIGFTPTTTQGIQLTAGAGITFESSYIPTGAVYVLSSVTASNFTILEA